MGRDNKFHFDFSPIQLPTKYLHKDIHTKSVCSLQNSVREKFARILNEMRKDIFKSAVVLVETSLDPRCAASQFLSRSFSLKVSFPRHSSREKYEKFQK